MELAIATLNAERDVALNNAPIHRAEGNIPQAEHAEQRAAELGQAAQALAAVRSFDGLSDENTYGGIAG